MSRIPRIENCDFYTTRNDDGKYVGRVEQFPKLRTRPQVLALDARDAIITMTRDKLARLDDAAMGHAPAHGAV